jgi:hypothetical protein
MGDQGSGSSYHREEQEVRESGSSYHREGWEVRESQSLNDSEAWGSSQEEFNLPDLPSSL